MGGQWLAQQRSRLLTRHIGRCRYFRASDNRELVAAIENGPAYRVGKVSLGAVRDFRMAEHWSIGAGGLFAVNFVTDALAPLYGSHNPTGAMGFVRLKLD